jgi:hypothetical protein
MSFINLQINVDELPVADLLEMEPMSADYEREVRTQQLIIWAPILLVSFLPVLVSGVIYLLAIPVLVLLLAGLIFHLVIRKSRAKGIAVREHDIAYGSGLYWRKTVMIAYNRIQHIEVSSGPLQRRFGLASLKFFTAGGSSVDLSVDGLQRERARQIRAWILARSDTADTE